MKKALFLVMAGLLLAGCSNSGSPSAHLPSPSPSATSQPSATADQQAAAQINRVAMPGLTPGRDVTVTLNSDTPLPRCALVQLDQRLVVINPQDTAAILTLGRAHWTVPAHSQGGVMISQAITRPGGYFMYVAGKNRQGGDNVSILVHQP